MSTEYRYILDEEEKSPDTRPEGKGRGVVTTSGIGLVGRVHCVNCREAVPTRSHNILADLCNRCVATADVAARDLLQAEQVFSATFHRSPSFIREFADWVLRTSLVTSKGTP